MFHQKSQSFPAVGVLPDSGLRKPLSLFGPDKVKNLIVFILEDKPIGLVYPGASLKDFAWKGVHTADTVDKGLRIASEAHFDVAILDAEVGGFESSPVALAVSKRGIPIVFCTTNPSQSLAGKLKKASVLQKPSPGEKLRAVLELADPRRH